MDYTTTKLAGELSVPHEQVVKKVKKYAGANRKAKGGKIYMSENKNRLKLTSFGRNTDGEMVYGFDKAAFDTCVSDEGRYNEKRRKDAVERGKKNWKNTLGKKK